MGKNKHKEYKNKAAWFIVNTIELESQHIIMADR
jgi:hypothetical protein